uniref:Peptidase S1 domain-containing protein n=1 Tax=Sphaeramia orbicularis TaxID=375764 RepID=A0A672ZW99_9TELE
FCKFKNCWFCFAVLIVAASACLADVAHAEETIKRSSSASRSSVLRSRRMVGGTLAPHVPWQALVYLNDSLLDGGYAGGALISDRWVLTAGRNLFVRKTQQDTQGTAPVIPKVYLGIWHTAEANASNEVAVEKIVLHPGFQNKSDWDNDLALIQLKEPVVMSDKVTPIPLPERDQDVPDTDGETGVIAGWGFGALLTASSSLKHLVLPVADHSACKREYKSDSLTPTVDEDMFCTGPSKYGENVCFGDDVYAAGILSYDKSCNNRKYAVYMKISSYLPWINAVVRGDTQQSSTLRSDAMSNMYLRQP